MNMKKKLLILPLLAATVITGCKKDDSGAEGPDNGNGRTSYLAVNIVSSNDAGPRATDGGFDKGTPAENTAAQGLFLFFDAAGNQTQEPQRKDLSWGETGDYKPNVERISEAVLVIENQKTIEPVELMVILNAPENIGITKSMSKTQVLATAGKYDAHAEGSFIMTNSVYKEDTDEICASSIAGHLETSSTAAESNPVDIYVERVVAKITTTSTTEIAPADIVSTTIKIDGKEVTLTPEIKGIEIANIAPQSYLFKNISGINYTNWIWNDPSNKRCYWATVPTGMTFGNKSYENITDDPTQAQKYYVQENTTNQPATNTSVLVTAVLNTVDESGNKTATEFVKHANVYYSKEGFKTYIAEILKNQGYRIKTTSGGNATYSTIKPNQIEYLEKHPEGSDMKGWEAATQLKQTEFEGITLVKYNTDNDTYEPTDVNEINTFLSDKKNRPWVWTEGKAYYFVEIEHFGVDATNKTLKGIVRNHVYNLQLNSLKGLGVPVFDPTETIIPEKPSDDAFYLAARINILKWKIVSQTVNFE